MQKNGVNFYTKLSNKYNLPYQVIKVICNHPFLFATEKISEHDEKPKMYAYFGKIKIKKRYAQQKDSKTEEDTKS